MSNFTNTCRIYYGNTLNRGCEELLKQLYITKLFGYKTVDISFNSDLTLLVGKNGCGKTTILNIISSIASGDIENLFNFDFQDIKLIYIYKKEQRKVEIIRKKINEELLLTWRDKSITIRPQNVFQLNNISKNNSEMLTKISKEINLLFIPLSRDTNLDDGLLSDNENKFAWGFENKNSKPLNVIDQSLDYVNKLVKENHRKIIIGYEELDKNMARDMFQSSFDYYPNFSNSLDRYQELNEDTLSQLKSAFRELGYLNDNFENAIDEFFNQLRDGSKAYELWTLENKEQSNQASAFITNISQVDRIIKWQKMVQETSYIKSNLQESMTNFLTILNEFLKESHKELYFDNKIGKLFFKTRNSSNMPLEKMSSGEKQIVIFFAYLIFEVSRNSNGVYIIDEPEISLHVSWQRRFAESIIGIVPNLQLIFATHSPEIVGPYRSNCVVLGSDN